MAGQVFAIASGKGGVGKTTTVVNLGVVLRRADHSVALVDADLGMANLGSMLGIEGGATLHDVLAGRAAVEEALHEEAPGFAVLPGSGSLADYPAADPTELGAVLETLAESYDFVLVDTGAGMSHEDVLPLGLADRVVLVASPDPAAIGDTRKTAQLAGLAGSDVAGLIVTKAEPDTDAKFSAAEVGVDSLGVIPYDPTVRTSTASGRPLEVVDPDAPATAAYRALADALTGTSAMDDAAAAGHESAASATRDGGAGPGADAAATGPGPEPTDDASDLPDGTTAIETDEPAEADTTIAADASEADNADRPADAADGAVEAAVDDSDEAGPTGSDRQRGFLSRIGRLFR